jgi:hypothetical protein
MPAYLPIPKGLQVPDQPEFEMPVTFEVRDNMLYALAVGGMPIPEEGAEPEEDMEMEMEMEQEGGENADMDFMSAVESAMKKPQPK